MSNFNDDELNAPSWLNEKFFEKVLKTSENTDTILIKNVNITPGTSKGDHYASVIFRGAVTYDTNVSKGNSKSMIIKTMPELEGYKKDFMTGSLAFKTEIDMYSKTLPKLQSELSKISDEVFAPKALYSSLEPYQVIVFEDVVPMGYKPHPKVIPRIEETKAVLLKLAKFNAVSYKLASEGDKTITEHRESFLNMNGITKQPFMTSGIENFIEKLKTIDILKKYVPKLCSVKKDLLERCAASANAYRSKNPQGIFTLCHGDFHSKNVMFKFNDKGEFEDLMLIDFQFSYFGPPILDVLNGIYMMFPASYREKHFDEIIYLYATHFIETLKKLQFKGTIPKVSDFFIEILRHRHWELFLFSSFLPMMYLVCKNSSIDAEEIMTSDDVRQNAYDNSNYIDEVKRILPKMIFKGYLD